jgi:hypothetical protein
MRRRKKRNNNNRRRRRETLTTTHTHNYLQSPLLHPQSLHANFLPKETKNLCPFSNSIAAARHC